MRCSTPSPTTLLYTLVLLVTAGLAVGTADAQDRKPRYLEAIEGELEAMEIASACEAETVSRARCTFRHRGSSAQREFRIHLVYSDATDTIYFYVDDYLTAPPDGPRTAVLLQRLMELNWVLLVGKFEWDSGSGEVRLAMVQNTDSNFDRRSFRSIVRTIGPLADRYLGELTRVLEERGEPADGE